MWFVMYWRNLKKLKSKVVINFFYCLGEGGTSVNYHVQYVEPQEIYSQPHQNHMWV